ncbi:MAG: ABC transporter ATP-binding protein [Geobacteraceae bacterium]|nr:ABC transporter ATP-binding protein [Geobacteraceae bacterium]
MTDTAFMFDNLGFGYRSGQWVLRGYRGKVKRGEVFAILGPNGRGKTTLLKLLIGALNPQEGTLRKETQLAFVPQLFQCSFPYTVFDMVLMGRANRVRWFSTPGAKDEQSTLNALERLDLLDLAERPFDELSGGQRQLVIFARALASGADTLILDEPTAALDMKNQGVILRWIRQLSREDGLTVIFTTHNPQHAHLVADTSMLMLGEHDFLCGSTDEVMTEEALHALYGVEMKRLRFEYGGMGMETFLPMYPGLCQA